MVKDFVRCGMCDMDFKSTEEWERHANTDLHQERLSMYLNMKAEGKLRGSAENIVKVIRKEVSGKFKFR